MDKRCVGWRLKLNVIGIYEHNIIINAKRHNCVGIRKLHLVYDSSEKERDTEEG